MADEVHRLIVRAVGEAEVVRLRAALEAEERALLNAARAHGGHDAASRAAATNVLRLQQELTQAQSSLVRMGGAVSGSGRGLLQLGRILDDTRQFQFGVAQGLNAIGNNLVEISPLLGIGAVAIGVLATQWDRIGQRVEGTSLAGPWRELNGVLQLVGQSLGLVATEAVKAKEAAEKAAEAVSRVRGTEEKRRGRAVTDVIERFGGGEAVGGLLRERARGRVQDMGQVAVWLQQALQGEEGGIGNILALVRRSSGRAALFGQELEAELARTAPENVAAAREERERIDRESGQAAAAAQAADRADEAAAREEERIVEEDRQQRVKTLAAGVLGTAILGGEEFDAANIQGFLEDFGGIRNVTREIAQFYLDKVNESLREEVQQRAVLEGIKPEEAQARSFRERTERSAQAGLKRAEEESPALRILTQAVAEAGFFQRGMVGAAGNVVALLTQAGLPTEQAEALARDFAAGAQRDALSESLRTRPRASEVVAGGAALSEAIQRGVGGEGDTARRHLEETRRTNQILGQLLQAPPEERPFVFRR